MAKAAYIGASGVARKVSKPYVGVGGVARRVKKALVGVDGVAREFFSGLHYTTQYVDYYPELGSEQSATFGEGTITLYQRSATQNDEEDVYRAAVNVLLHGLSAGDVVSFDYNYDGAATTSNPYYSNALVDFTSEPENWIVVLSRDSSGTKTFTVTEGQSGSALRFTINNGRGRSKVSQTFSITNLKVNGSLVSA